MHAMYDMLSRDRTLGAEIRKCERQGCPNYFRVGSQRKTKYCPHEDPEKRSKCASRDSSRNYRERRES